MSRHLDAAAGIIASSFVAGGGPAPTLRSSSIQEGSGAAVTAIEPTGAALNDILLLLVMAQDQSGGLLSIGTPTGWTQAGTTLADGASGSSFFLASVFWIRRGSSAPVYVVPMVGATSGYIEVQVAAFQGCVASGTPFDVVQTGSVTMANPSSPVCPAITTLTANSTVVLQGISWGGSLVAGFTPPSTFAIINNTSSEGANNSTCTAYKTQASPGTVTPGAFGNVNSGNDPCGGISLALHA